MIQRIRDTKLELLRSGPEHNQLLSPLTPYIALCGPWPPRTVTMPFEHRELVTRLARLRYSAGGSSVSAEQSETELASIGAAVGRVLGEVPGLQAALTDVARDGAHLVHLRLSLSALELGMMPFEAAIAPDNLPGSGAPLLLRTPTVITREIRRSQPIDVNWNRDHRILFAFFTPPGMEQVPAQQHLNALRRAIEPYVPIVKSNPQERVRQVQEQLTVLPEASLKEIGDACRSVDYTHVHILAHGAPVGDGVTRRYGVALRDEGSPNGYKVVDGETLAIALRGADSSTAANKKLPTFLSLATCDSGAVDSVVVPGGSIAHELHRVGIPWVVASQFPLWMRASTIMVEALYRGILSGDDPRVVLYQLRQRLRIEVPQTHDWASIVAYAVSPWSFDEEIEAFFDRQVRRRLNVKFARLDELAAAHAAPTADAAPIAAKDAQARAVDEAEFTALGAAIRKEHAVWLDRPSVAPSGTRRAEVLGMSAASEKRIAIALARKAQAAGDAPSAKDDLRNSDAAYDASRKAYRQAIEIDPTNHWAITQFVSIVATPRLMSTDELQTQVRTRYAPWWNAARQIARWQLSSATGLQRGWSLGTLAELELLGSVYEATGHDAEAASQRIDEVCREIVRLGGIDSFMVASTRRQFTRYLTDWDSYRWRRHAQTALQALADKDPESEKDRDRRLIEQRSDQQLLEQERMLREKEQLLREQAELNLDDLKQLQEARDAQEFRRNRESSIVLNRFELRGFAALEDTQWRLQSGINVLLGRNGYGKSLVLRAIASLLTRNDKLFATPGAAPESLRLELSQDGRAEEIVRDARGFERSVGPVPVLAIPDTRFMNRSEDVLRQATDPYAELARHGARHVIENLPYHGIVQGLLYGLCLDYYERGRSFDLPLFNLLTKVFAGLTDSTFRFAAVDRVDAQSFQLMVITEGNRAAVPIQAASQGTLSVLAIFGLIFRFLATLAGSEERILQRRAIVMIDEIDAHLHPSWQQRITAMLREHFPNVQFILSAHSPLIVAGCLPGEVAVLRKRDLNKDEKQDKSRKGESKFFIDLQERDFVGARAKDIYEKVFEIDDGSDPNYLAFSEQAARGVDNSKRIHELESRGLLDEPERLELERLRTEAASIRRAHRIEEERALQDDIAVQHESELVRLQSNFGQHADRIAALERENDLLRSHVPSNVDKAV